MVRAIEVSGDQIEVRGDIGSGRVVRATLIIDDGKTENEPALDPNDLPLEEWQHEFDAMMETAPLNDVPADDSREAIYGLDPKEMDSAD